MTTDRFKELADEDVVLRQVPIPAVPILGWGGLDDPEAFSALRPLPRGRWRSIGQHLDYTHWPDRERFKQLDREIESHSRAQVGCIPVVPLSKPHSGARFGARRVIRRVPVARQPRQA